MYLFNDVLAQSHTTLAFSQHRETPFSLPPIANVDCKSSTAELNLLCAQQDWPYKKAAKTAPANPSPRTGCSRTFAPAVAGADVREAAADVPADPEAPVDPEVPAEPEVLAPEEPVVVLDGAVWVTTVVLAPEAIVENPVLATGAADPETTDVMTGGDPTTGTMELLGTAGMPAEPETKEAAAGWEVTATG